MLSTPGLLSTKDRFPCVFSAAAGLHQSPMLLYIAFWALPLLVLAPLLAVPVALVVAGVYSYKRRVFRYFLLLLGGAPIALYAAFTIWDTHSNLRALPPALDVKEMVYSKETGWTSETRGAFRVFVLPDHVANALAAKGLGFFRAGEFGRFGGWQPTPVVRNNFWDVDTREWYPVPRLDGVRGFLCHRGLVFCVWPDDSAVGEANAIAFSPGSYYAYDGQVALIFVSPGQKRVIYISQ
jgi:hypothetical protein